MITGWFEFAGVFALFLATHYLPPRPGLRGACVAHLGERVYLAVYSLISLVLLGWLIVAAGRAPFIALWGYAPWQSWVPNLLMPPALLLAAFAIAAPNPFSFGGRRPRNFDSERPGIAGITRHPLLWAIALWAGAHLVPNGNLAHVLLFGFFLAMAFAGMAILDRRARRRMGASQWRDQARSTALIPFAAALRGDLRLRGFDALPTRLAAFAAAYLVLLSLHGPVLGVSPFPV
ncbi:MAG: NnrU family protein [Salinarimonas sp.]|nr:NnrU family protein [Salinarimonas sp.]